MWATKKNRGGMTTDPLGKKGANAYQEHILVCWTNRRQSKANKNPAAPALATAAGVKSTTSKSKKPKVAFGRAHFHVAPARPLATLKAVQAQPQPFQDFSEAAAAAGACCCFMEYFLTWQLTRLTFVSCRGHALQRGDSTAGSVGHDLLPCRICDPICAPDIDFRYRPLF